MSLMIQAYLLEKYGPRLDAKDMADLLEVEPKTIYNKISANTLGIKTYSDGGKTWADIRDVAAYLDSLRLIAA